MSALKEILAEQRELEAALGDVTARSAMQASGGSRVVPNLLQASGASGNADLVSGTDKTLQLDALLAKASQYSAFIRNSQTQAEGAFFDHATKMMGDQSESVGEDEVGGKRKKGGKGAAHKKSKGEGEVAMAEAAAKMSGGKAGRSKSFSIFH